MTQDDVLVCCWRCSCVPVLCTGMPFFFTGMPFFFLTRQKDKEITIPRVGTTVSCFVLCCLFIIGCAVLLYTRAIYLGTYMPDTLYSAGGWKTMPLLCAKCETSPGWKRPVFIHHVCMIHTFPWFGYRVHPAAALWRWAMKISKKFTCVHNHFHLRVRIKACRYILNMSILQTPFITPAHDTQATWHIKYIFMSNIIQCFIQRGPHTLLPVAFTSTCWTCTMPGTTGVAFRHMAQITNLCCVMFNKWF